MERGYRVVVEYQEPAYELRSGHDSVYKVAYDVRAASPAQAVRMGLDEFHTTARLSNVSWAREVRRAFAVVLAPDETLHAEFLYKPSGQDGPPQDTGERRSKSRVA